MFKTITLFLVVLCISKMSLAQNTEQEIRKSVITFVDSLTPFQKKRALLDFNDTARIKWNNLPVGLRARAGVNIGSMSDEQRKLVHRILSASLSSQGYLKATSIMHLDNLLNIFVDTMHKRKEIDDSAYQMMKDLKWSHENYYMAVFGNPAGGGDWGYK
ncbi:MAG: DUF3500 domain-containing protein, partial [Flavisolibacter sp.]